MSRLDDDIVFKLVGTLAGKASSSSMQIHGLETKTRSPITI